MKYRIGDKVRIRADLRFGASYTNVDGNHAAGVNEYMMSLAGREAIITSVGGYWYHINIDTFEWYWRDEMFEGQDPDITQRVVRSDLKPFRKYGGVTFVPPMLRYVGKVPNGSDFIFTNEMLEEVAH